MDDLAAAPLVPSTEIETGIEIAAETNPESEAAADAHDRQDESTAVPATGPGATGAGPASGETDLVLDKDETIVETGPVPVPVPVPAAAPVIAAAIALAEVALVIGTTRAREHHPAASEVDLALAVIALVQEIVVAAGATATSPATEIEIRVARAPA